MLSDYDFVAMMYNWGFDVKSYVPYTISAEEYEKITGEAYAA